MIHIHTLRQQWLFSILFVFISTIALSQKEGQLSFLFIGDVMQHGPQINGALNPKTGEYEYEKSFKFIKPVIESVDIAIANLEVTHAGKPYSGYPQFSAPDELSKALQNTGIDVLLTCNNHSCDGGGRGVVRTLDILDGLGIVHTGTFRNKKERDANYPLIIDKNGMKVAILNYTYGTNGLVVPAPIIINYIDSSVMKADFAKAREKADYIICTLHWGAEYQHLPNDYQKNYEKYCYELGADMVIGGHPHVIQPALTKTVKGEEKLTAWSLGNFVSNQRDRYKNGGMLVQAVIERNQNIDGKGNSVSLKEANYWLAYVHKREEGVFKPYYILPDFNYNALSPGFLPTTDLALMREFFADSRKLMKDHGNLNELTLSDIETSGFYEKEMAGYFTIKLSEYPKDLKMLNGLIHRMTDSSGEHIWISGRCLTIEDAELNLALLSKIGVEGTMNIVRVTPDGIKQVNR